MTRKKTIKTILFASLIATMILPFSTMELAVAEKDALKQTEKSLKESSDWAKLLLKTNDYKSLGDTTKIKYLEFAQAMLDDKDPYQAAMMELVEDYSRLQLIIESAPSNQDVSDEKNQRSIIIEELEDIGVVSEDKYKANPEYWNEKIRKAKEAKGSYKRVSGESSDFEYHLVHTDDVSIRREAIVTVLCIPGDTASGCPVGDIGWGPGTSSTWGMQLQTGNAAWSSYGCLENDVQHTTVSWTMTGHHELNWSLWGNPTVTTHNGNMAVSGTNNNCVGWVDTDSVDAGYLLASETIVGNQITVTGTHA